MPYKMELVLNVTVESKEDADRLAHRIMVGMENNAENYDGVLSALATRSRRSEVFLNLPKEEGQG